tara:strand:+ start:489 stop:2003 length:1515 start_codon:yes stop_codon:yes gene_type:complete
MAMGLTKADSEFLSKTHKEAKEQEKKETERNKRKLTEPCDVERILVTSNKQEGGEPNTVDLSGGLIRLMYYESLLSNTIGATYTYSDSGNSVNNNKEGTKCDNTGTVIDKLPLEGNELVELSFTDNRNNNLEVKLRVNSPTSFDDKTTKSAAQLQLVSEEFLENQSVPNRVRKCLEGKISQHVETILKDNLKSATVASVEETAVNYNFIGNTRKPFYCINLLSTKSSPQGEKKAGNSAGFLFWQTSEGYHFRSIDALFGQPQKKSVIYNETPATNDDDPAAGYDLKALAYSRDNAINVKNKLMMGAYSTVLKPFDLYDPKLPEMMTSTAYDPKGTNLPGSQDTLTLAGEELADLGGIEKFPSRIIYQVKDTGVQPGGDTDEQLDKSKEENFDLSNIYNQAIMRYNQLFSSTVTITIGGDFSLHAGDAIWVDNVGLKADSISDDINEKDGGLYIISDIAHYISPKETYTKMNLIRDSTGRKGTNAFRKDTNAHTIMQDGFAANIK